MDIKIETSGTLFNLVEMDNSDHSLKDIATLFLTAMNDWPTPNLTSIEGFVTELKLYFGTPLTVECINSKKLNKQNAWELESGCSIIELLHVSESSLNETDFDKVFENMLNFYNGEFKQVDFIAELQYLTTEQSGRKTPTESGYRPHIKFEFSEMQTSGYQTYIDRKLVFPGEQIKAKIKIASPDHFANSLNEGMSFDFREGDKIIGTGRIDYIVNEKINSR